MILALLALILVLSASGWLMLTTTFFGVPWVEDLHALAANGLLIAIPLHLLGVIASSFMHREHLILAMITGNKLATAAEARAARNPDQAPQIRRGVALLLALALIGFGYGWITTGKRVSTSMPEPAAKIMHK